MRHETFWEMKKRVKEAVRPLERAWLISLLESTSSINEAASAAKMSPAPLYVWVRRHKINVKRLQRREKE